MYFWHVVVGAAVPHRYGKDPYHCDHDTGTSNKTQAINYVTKFCVQICSLEPMY